MSDDGLFGCRGFYRGVRWIPIDELHTNTRRRLDFNDYFWPPPVLYATFSAATARERMPLWMDAGDAAWRRTFVRGELCPDRQMIGDSMRSVESGGFTNWRTSKTPQRPVNSAVEG